MLTRLLCDGSYFQRPLHIPIAKLINSNKLEDIHIRYLVNKS